jgi:hypothetical protein
MITFFPISDRDVFGNKIQNMNPARAIELNMAVVTSYSQKLNKIMFGNSVIGKPEYTYVQHGRKWVKAHTSSAAKRVQEMFI